MGSKARTPGRRPPELSFNLDARGTPATPSAASNERKKEKKRPTALTALPQRCAPQVEESFRSQCDQWGGAKTRGGGTPASATPPPSSGDDRGTPEASTPQIGGNGGGAQIGSEGASTTASSAGDFFDLQGIEELERLSKLGAGVSGVVEKHRHTRTGREMALKIIQAKDIAEPQRKAILLELRTFAKCRNPHIVYFYGAFFHENNIHIALEYMDAGALSTILERKRTVPEKLLANITWQVLDGLEYLHREMHVIHRDLKPSNILLNYAGIVKITDFGVSGELDDDIEQRAKVTWVGTIYYMSPERVRGLPYRYDSDMWSLGLMILECFSGRKPYASGSRLLSFWELMKRIAEEDPPRFQLGDGHTSQLQDFVGCILNKEPRDRASAAMMKMHAWLGAGPPTLAQQAELASWIIPPTLGLEKSTEHSLHGGGNPVSQRRVGAEPTLSQSCHPSGNPAVFSGETQVPVAPPMCDGGVTLVPPSVTAEVPRRQWVRGDGSALMSMSQSVRGGGNPFAQGQDGAAMRPAQSAHTRNSLSSVSDEVAAFASGSFDSAALRDQPARCDEGLLAQPGYIFQAPVGPSTCGSSATPDSPSAGAEGLRRQWVSNEEGLQLNFSRSLRGGGDNPFAQRKSEGEMRPEDHSPHAGHNGSSLERGCQGQGVASPMEQSLPRGGVNPFMRPEARAECS